MKSPANIALCLLVSFAWGAQVQLAAAPLNPRDFNDFGLWERQPNGEMVFDESAIENGRLSSEAIHQLAENGNITAQRVLGTRMTFAEESSSLDRAHGVEWLEKAATGGDVQAQENLAEALIKGVGTTVDQPGALEWLKKAAVSGSVEALFRAGDLQIRGSSDVRDETAGFVAIHEAARKKHPKALERLAQCYRFGIGTPKSTFKFLLTARHALKANPSAGYFRIIVDVIYWGAIVIGGWLLMRFIRLFKKGR